VIALAALGVALWALLDDTGDSDRQDASRVRVERLADRVDRLESQLGEAASGGCGRMAVFGYPNEERYPRDVEEHVPEDCVILDLPEGLRLNLLGLIVQI
jgi:hypothetical protein